MGFNLYPGKLVDFAARHKAEFPDQGGAYLFLQHGNRENATFQDDIRGIVIFVAADGNARRFGSDLEYGVSDVTCLLPFMYRSDDI